MLEWELKRGLKELKEEWKAIQRGRYVSGRELQAIGRLKRKGPPELERLKRRLEQVYESQTVNRPPRTPPKAHCLISYRTLLNIYRESTVLLWYCYGIGPCGSRPQYCLIL